MAVNLHINGQVIEAPRDGSLFDYADACGVRVPTSCQKQGKCKECILEVVRGMELLSERSPDESHLNNGFRLACRARVISESGEIHCHTMRRGALRIESRSYSTPLFRRGSFSPDPAVVREGPLVRVDGSTSICAGGPIHGLAIDVGTTTIVLRLFDLESGRLIADSSFENPQRFGGSDIMARICYDTEHRGNILMRILAGYISRAIEEFPVDPKTIYEAVVVGNSTMRDLFFRRSVYSIGQSPYQSITEIEVAAGKRSSTSLAQPGRRSLLPIHPDARVYGAPIISGHVGADAAACMLAVDLAHEERLVAIMDIGTNTELVVGNRERILAASCPAGPAFEGGSIACGMPALDGAIEKVEIDDYENIRTTVIGNIRPEGICGSGLVELLSELLRTGRMNALGRFEDGMPCITIDEAGGIFLFERDVNELAQAKGANVAGLYTVFSNYRIGFEEIEVFYLAGGFGRHINVEAAKRIGLIPPLDDSRIVKIGNAAIEGASIALLSKTKRDELEKLVARVDHCRLETHPQFFDFFVEGCQFKPLEAMCETTK